MIRKTVIAILALLLIYGALRIARVIGEKPPEPRFNTPNVITPVFTQTVVNGTIPISIKTSGNLVARNKMELFAEVQGVFTESAHNFKPGEYYREGETLLRIRDKEERINLQAQRSAFLNQLVLLLPDLRFDYEASLPQWEAYIENYHVDSMLQALPEPVSDKERLFLTGRNIYTTFYNVKNLESELEKFHLQAPYDGVLTEALVDKGTLIRPGQKLGEFINPYVYELEVAVNGSYGDLLQVGKEVRLTDAERDSEWLGRVVRVNRRVDPGTQTIPVFIVVSGRGLREGMYMQADLQAEEVKDAFEIERELLVDQGMVYVVTESELVLTTVNPVYFKENTVLITGLPDQTKILARRVPGAYHGMKVNSLGDL